jgi:hypothetical protein
MIEIDWETSEKDELSQLLSDYVAEEAAMEFHKEKLKSIANAIMAHVPTGYTSGDVLTSSPTHEAIIQDRIKRSWDKTTITSLLPPLPELPDFIDVVVRATKLDKSADPLAEEFIKSASCEAVTTIKVKAKS